MKLVKPQASKTLELMGIKDSTLKKERTPLLLENLAQTVVELQQCFSDFQVVFRASGFCPQLKI